jgi:hypothetical protein
MGHAPTCSDVGSPQNNNGGHRLAKWIAVIAMFFAMLLITWARVVIHGTDDLQETLIEAVVQPDQAQPPARADARTEEKRDVDAAVTTSRFATGLSP